MYWVIHLKRNWGTFWENKAEFWVFSSAHPPHGPIFRDEVPGCLATEVCDLPALSESGMWETIHISVQQGTDGGNSSTLQRKYSKGTKQLVTSYIMENYLCKNNNSLTAIPFLVLKINYFIHSTKY